MPRKDVASIAVAEAVTSDEELGRTARALASTAMAVAQDMLDNGPPQTQLRIVASLLPAIGRALSAQAEDEEMGELRGQLRSLQQSMLDAS